MHFQQTSSIPANILRCDILSTNSFDFCSFCVRARELRSDHYVFAVFFVFIIIFFIVVLKATYHVELLGIRT
jgi:hypothetical protein